MAHALHISIFICASVLAGVLLIGRIIKWHLTSGIQQLRTVTKKVGHGDFTVRARLDENDEELIELAEGFNQIYLLGVNRKQNLVP